MVFAHAPAGEDHGLAGNKARIAAFFHLTGKINAVFIIETRPVDGDPDVAFGKSGQVDIFDGGDGAVVDLVQN